MELRTRPAARAALGTEAVVMPHPCIRKRHLPRSLHEHCEVAELPGMTEASQPGSHLPPFGRGARDPLGERHRPARAVDERLANLQCPPCPLSRSEIELRRSGDGHAADEAWRRDRGRDHHRRLEHRHHQSVRPRLYAGRRLRGQRLSLVGDACPAIATSPLGGAGTSSSPGSSSSTGSPISSTAW